ncbi:MAG TPA: hypothetical protein VN033_10675 [Vulgatibacter sp.]|nr:hypothetical protein [Vulgatibacter sp.]
MLVPANGLDLGGPRPEIDGDKHPELPLGCEPGEEEAQGVAGQEAIPRNVLGAELREAGRRFAVQQATLLCQLQRTAECDEFLLDRLVGRPFALALVDVALYVVDVEFVHVEGTDQPEQMPALLRVHLKGCGSDVRRADFHQVGERLTYLVRGRVRGCTTCSMGFSFLELDRIEGGFAVGAFGRERDPLPLAVVVPPPPVRTVLPPVDGALACHGSAILLRR